MEALFKLIVIAIIVFVCVTIGPYLFIWSINVLIAAAMVGAPASAFVPQIAFSFWTWLAALLLGGLGIFATRSNKS